MPTNCSSTPNIAWPKRGFTVCELLVTTTCVGLLLALLLPTIVHTRELARQATCCSQLRQLGIATQTYHDAHQRFPAAWRREHAEPNLIRGWATTLLPAIGEQPVAQMRGMSTESNDDLSRSSIALFLCPSDIASPTFVLREDDDYQTQDASSSGQSVRGRNQKVIGVLPTANYVGVFGTTEADDLPPFPRRQSRSTSSDGTIVHDQRVGIVHLERGTANTLLIGERTMAMVPSTWLGVDVRGEDAQCRLVGSAITRPNCEICDECEFSSRHEGGVNFLWADGHVSLMEDHVESSLYRQFAQRFVR